MSRDKTLRFVYEIKRRIVLFLSPGFFHRITRSFIKTKSFANNACDIIK